MTFKEWWGENEPHLNKETEELITRLEEIYAEHIEKKKNGGEKRMKFDDACILTAAFILTLPFTILWTIMNGIDKISSKYEKN